MFEVVTAVYCLGVLWTSRWTMCRAQTISPTFLFAVISVVFINTGFVVFFNDRYAFDTEASLTALLSVSLGLGAVVAWGVAGTALLALDRSAWQRLPGLGLKTDISVAQACVVAAVVYLLSLLPFLVQGSIPLLDAFSALLSGGLSDNHMNILRNNSDPYLNPDAARIPLRGLFDAIRYEGVPVVCLWFLWFFRSGTRRTLSALFFAAGVLVTMSSGQRWPLMYSIASVVVFVSCTEPDPVRYRRMKWALVATAAGLGVILSTLLARSLGEGTNALQALAYGVGDLFHRLFLGNIDTPFTCYSVFPSRYDWLLGKSYVQNLMCFIPIAEEKKGSFAVTLYKLLYEDSAFTAPPDMYTEAYVNFGIPGVAAVSFLWGWLLAWSQRALTRTRGLVGCSCLVVVIVNLCFSVVSGSVFILNSLISCAIILAIVWATGLSFGSSGRFARRARKG